jgi:hypothetical protein
MSTILKGLARGGAVGVLFAVAVFAGLPAGQASAQVQVGGDAAVDVKVKVVATTTAPRGEMRLPAGREVKPEMQAVREKLEGVKKEAQDKMQAIRADFKAKLSQVKDEKKKQTAENLHERLGTLNEKWTMHFGDVLDKYAEVLKRVESRRDKVQAAGKDTAAVNAALQAAQAAITRARTTVEVQAAKTYEVTVTTDVQLRAAFQTAHTALKKDLMALRDGAMRDAREAVQKAIQSLRAIPDVDKVRAAATSSQQ